MRMVALVAAAVMTTAISFSSVRAQSPSGDALSHQKEALDVIQNFADGFCKTIPMMGKSSSVEATVEAKAGLRTVLRKLFALGISGAAKYENEEWEGPLRESLVVMTRDNLTCRDNIWHDLKAKLLPSSKKTEDALAGSYYVSLGPRLQTQSVHQIMTATKATEEAKLRASLS